MLFIALEPSLSQISTNLRVQLTVNLILMLFIKIDIIKIFAFLLIDATNDCKNILSQY